MELCKNIQKSRIQKKHNWSYPNKNEWIFWSSIMTTRQLVTMVLIELSAESVLCSIGQVWEKTSQHTWKIVSNVNDTRQLILNRLDCYKVVQLPTDSRLSQWTFLALYQRHQMAFNTYLLSRIWKKCIKAKDLIK